MRRTKPEELEGRLKSAAQKLDQALLIYRANRRNIFEAMAVVLGFTTAFIFLSVAAAGLGSKFF